MACSLRYQMWATLQHAQRVLPVLLVLMGLVSEACAGASPRVLRSSGDLVNKTLLADLASMPPLVPLAPLPAAATASGVGAAIAAPTHPPAHSAENAPTRVAAAAAATVVAAASQVGAAAKAAAAAAGGKSVSTTAAGVGADSAAATPTGSADRPHAAAAFKVPASPPWWLWLVVALAFAALLLLLACVQFRKSTEGARGRIKTAKSMRNGKQDIYESVPSDPLKEQHCQASAVAAPTKQDLYKSVPTCATSLEETHLRELPYPPRLPTSYSLPQATAPLKQQHRHASAVAAPTKQDLHKSAPTKQDLHKPAPTCATSLPTSYSAAENAIRALAAAPTMRVLPSAESCPTGKTCAAAPPRSAQWGKEAAAPPEQHQQKLDSDFNALPSAASLANCSVPAMSWWPGFRS